MRMRSMAFQINQPTKGTESGTINPGPARPVQSAAMTRHCPQAQLFKELPSHLAQMAFYKVNTGCRDVEICNLRWDWEVKVPTQKKLRP
jgi:hypothetical protein